MKDIKTKSAIKDIKVLDKSTDVSSRAKKAYIRTKEQAEQVQRQDYDSFVEYAEDKVKEGTKAVTRKAGHAAGRQGKKAVQIIKEHRSADTGTNYTGAADGYTGEQTSYPETANRQTGSQNTAFFKAKQTAPPMSEKGPEQLNSTMQTKQSAQQKSAQTRTKETIRRKYTLSKPNELAKRRFVQIRAKQRLTEAGEIRSSIQKAAQTQAWQTVERITLQPVCPPLFQPAEKAAAQALHPSDTPERTIKQAADTGVKSIKEFTKGTLKTAAKSIKAADHTAKAAVKTSQAAAKTAAKTAQTAQRAVQATRTAARAAAVSPKTAAKAMLTTIKAIIAAAKSLIALIAAGGWIAVVVILVICLAGLLLGSAFDIFYSNESFDGNTPVMTEVVNQLIEEFTAEIQRIKVENPHDTLELSGSDSISANQWREILAVYTVKAAADPENGMEVATLDDTKVGILRDVFWDMNKIDYWIETIVHEETVTTADEDGNETTETITTTETILHINITSRSHTDMIAECGFNPDQVKMLNELMKDEYQELFMQLTGS